MKTEGTEKWENVFLVSLCATLTEKKKMNETLGEIDPKTAKSRKWCLHFSNLYFLLYHSGIKRSSTRLAFVY